MVGVSQQPSNCPAASRTCLAPPPWCQRLVDEKGCVKCLCGQGILLLWLSYAMCKSVNMSRSKIAFETMQVNTILSQYRSPVDDKAQTICVFQVSRPCLGFCPNPKHFIENCEQSVVKSAGKWGKCIKNGISV